jgi:hypothetical protein
VEKQNMPDALGDTADNVIPVWGLMPDEWLKICAQAQKLIRQGRATDISEERRGTYICVHDRHAKNAVALISACMTVTERLIQLVENKECCICLALAERQSPLARIWK